ncbi:MAG: RHS repeat-associated core domain-containing protein [Gemmatimonadaceae bacterium]|nr:RHS repeat-associated core domain-containing protein [Gemmatimonadaceae bacterium]
MGTARTRRLTGDSITFGYDAAGRPSSVTFDRGTLGFSFNSLTGTLTSLSAPGGLGLALTYDGSLPTSLTWSGTVAGSTQRTAYSYDSHGALSAMLSRLGTDTLFRTSYTRDSLSRITQLIERIGAGTDTLAFAYDSVGRLSSVSRNGSVTASYTYDLNGNRATQVTSGGTLTATVDDQDRLLSYGTATYGYTAHGDLLWKAVGTDTTHYSYDALGNLVQVLLPDGTDIGYLIDAQNRRIGKTVNDTLVRAWLYQGQLTPVAELDGSGNVVSRFVYATGVNVPDYLVRGDSTYRLVRDHLGSVRLVVNVATGTVAQRIDYDAFGIEVQNTNPGWQPFGYAGGLGDAQTGLVRFGARDYDPVAGRWTAKDPIGFLSGSTSLYAYASGEPVNLVDYTGSIAVAPILWGAGAGAVGGALESIALQMLLNGCIDWSQVAIDATIGAAGGAAASALKIWNGVRRAAQSASGAERGGLNLYKYLDPTSTKASGWKEGDRFLNLPDRGSYKANWKQNASRLREEMRSGNPIFDSYRDARGELIPTKGFLNAERQLLENQGWRYSSSTGAWHPRGGL